MQLHTIEIDCNGIQRFCVEFACHSLPSSPQAVINTLCGHGAQHLNTREAGAVIHTSGCIDKLVDWIHSNLFLLGGVALGLAIPQVIFRNNQREEYCMSQQNCRHPDAMSTVVPFLIVPILSVLCSTARRNLLVSESHSADQGPDSAPAVQLSTPLRPMALTGPWTTSTMLLRTEVRITVRISWVNLLS